MEITIETESEDKEIISKAVVNQDLGSETLICSQFSVLQLYVKFRCTYTYRIFRL